MRTMYVFRAVLDIVPEVSMYRNIKLSIHQIEHVLLSIPWHPRAYADTERKF